MGILDSVMADDGLAFCDSDVFAESVTYTKANGTTRTINAQIFRQPPSPANGHPVASVTVHVVNSSTTGIAASEIEPGRDKITFAPRLGKDTVAMTLPNPEQQDAGMLTFRFNA